MATVDVDNSSLQKRTHSPSRLTWSEGRQPLGAVLHSSDDWVNCRNDLYHDSTINIVKSSSSSSSSSYYY